MIGDQVVSGRPTPDATDRPGHDPRRTLVAGAGRDRPRPGHDRPLCSASGVGDTDHAASRRTVGRTGRLTARAARRGPGRGTDAHRGRHRRVGQHAGRGRLDEPDGPCGAHPRRRTRSGDALSRRSVRHGRGPRQRRRRSPRPPCRRRRRARQTYLDAKADVDPIAQLYVPILLAFSIFALLAAAFTIANVVSGIVLTSYRDIGVMKAVGFTPVQVTASSSARSSSPVTIGAVAGVIIGTIASQPIVERDRAVVRAAGRVQPLAAGRRARPRRRRRDVAARGDRARGPCRPPQRRRRDRPRARPVRRRDGGRLRRLGLRLPVGVPGRLGVAAGLAHPAGPR